MSWSEVQRGGVCKRGTKSKIYHATWKRQSLTCVHMSVLHSDMSLSPLRMGGLPTQFSSAVKACWLWGVMDDMFSDFYLGRS